MDSNTNNPLNRIALGKNWNSANPNYCNAEKQSTVKIKAVSPEVFFLLTGKVGVPTTVYGQPQCIYCNYAIHCQFWVITNNLLGTRGNSYIN